MQKLSNEHWNSEGYKERMTTKDWRTILLTEEDRIIFRGRSRKLVAKRIGPGVYEVYKEPLKDVLPKV